MRAAEAWERTRVPSASDDNLEWGVQSIMCWWRTRARAGGDGNDLFSNGKQEQDLGL